MLIQHERRRNLLILFLVVSALDRDAERRRAIFVQSCISSSVAGLLRATEVRVQARVTDSALARRERTLEAECGVMLGGRTRRPPQYQL